MHRERWWDMRRWLAAAVLLAAVIPARLAQPASDAPGSEPERAAAPAAVLSRVAVIGASATCGFGAEIDIDGPFGRTTAMVDFATVLDAMLPEQCTVNGHCSVFFFNEPLNVGPQIVEDALAGEPTLIVGIDYLFWYGYGSRDVNGQRLTDESARLALLEQGLKQLERFECPVVVGDYPNMKDAVGRMLGAAQLPQPQTLAALNERVREWARGRPNVVVVPLSELVDAMQRGDEVRIGEAVWTAEDVAAVIQGDQLHPTLDGMVLMMQHAVQAIVTSDLGVDAELFELDRQRVLARVRTLAEQRATAAREATKHAAPAAGEDESGE